MQLLSNNSRLQHQLLKFEPMLAAFGNFAIICRPF